jgi:pre-rRNA-processing protein TSR1
VLTGHPIRVRKRFAVVRHLFYEPQVRQLMQRYLLSVPVVAKRAATVIQDVRWFKPAELVTKWGLRGHITEPVGTHGLLKAVFNGAIKQNDTVMLILYKRVYPKFPAAGLQLQ